MITMFRLIAVISVTAVVMKPSLGEGPPTPTCRGEHAQSFSKRACPDPLQRVAVWGSLVLARWIGGLQCCGDGDVSPRIDMDGLPGLVVSSGVRWDLGSAPVACARRTPDRESI